MSAYDQKLLASTHCKEARRLSIEGQKAKGKSLASNLWCFHSQISALIFCPFPDFWVSIVKHDVCIMKTGIIQSYLKLACLLHSFFYLLCSVYFQSCANLWIVMECHAHVSENSKWCVSMRLQWKPHSSTPKLDIVSVLANAKQNMTRRNVVIPQHCKKMHYWKWLWHSFCRYIQNTSEGQPSANSSELRNPPSSSTSTFNTSRDITKGVVSRIKLF
jgi:hypothetical protein